MNSTRTLERRAGVVAVLAGGLASGLALALVSQYLEPDRTVLRALQENFVVLMMGGSGAVLWRFRRFEKAPGWVIAGATAMVQALTMSGMMVAEVFAEGAVFGGASAVVLALSVPVAVGSGLAGFGLLNWTSRAGRKPVG